MKVLHFKSGSYLPLTETWIYNQIKNLKRYKAIIYTHYTENLNIFPTNEIRAINNINMGYDKKIINRALNIFFPFYHYYPYYMRWLLVDKPDIIHAHFGPSGYEFLKLKQLFKIPMVTNFYGFDLSSLPQKQPKWKKKYEKLFKIGEMFIVEGNYMKQTLVNLGCPDNKIIVNHLGIDLGNIEFTPRLFPDDGVVKILVSGSFREKKGIPYAIEAFGRVVARRPDINLKMTIIGDSRGEPREELEKRKILYTINKYKLNDFVNLLGYQPHHVLLQEAKNHHIFISPSVTAEDGDTEGGAPVTLAEMSASGMPIISNTHCDIPEVINDGKSGFLVPERDVDALTEKLEFLICNPEIWGKMGRCGRKHIEKEYDVIKQVNKLELLYDKLLFGNNFTRVSCK